MKNFVKRILLSVFTAILSLCCISVAAVNLKTTSASAATALETEFTNNGQVVLSQYGSNTLEYVDGVAGATGTALKITQTTQTAFVMLSVPSVKASDLGSIVVRIYSPSYTSEDSFRAAVDASGNWQQNDAVNMGSWVEVTLNAKAIAMMTDADGYLSTPIAVGARAKSNAEYYYIDSITVNVKKQVSVELTGVHSWWNNYSHNDMYCSILEFSGGIAKGDLNSDYSDVYAKATLNGQPVDAENLDFVCRAWIDGQADSIVMRWKTLPASGAILHIPAGATFKNGGDDTNIYAIAKDIYLQLNGSTWAVTEKPAMAEKATFNSIWGNVDTYNASDRVLLIFNSTTAWNHTDKGTLASKVTYKNSETGATYSPTNNDIAGWDGQRWIVFTGTTDYDIIQIMDGGQFGGVEIPALTLYKVNGRWVTTAPHTATTNFTAIAGGWNNNTTYNAGLGQTILAYDVNPLGAAADATNLAATINRTSLMVKYNGKTFAELYADANNANAKKYAISYAHGKGYFYFAIPEADFVEGATFEIEEGTPFMNNYLAATKLVLKDGAWQGPKADAEFYCIWKNVDAYNSADRVLLQYNSADAWVHTDKGDLASKVTYKNSTTGATRAATDADITGWDGQKWIIFSNLTDYDVIEIAEGGSFGGGIGIPALTIYKVNGRWVTTAPHSATTNFTAIAGGWNNNLGNGISNNIFSFDVKPLGDAADATNLAATLNRTSLMVKYNGKTFAELYASNNNYAISYAHGNNHFYFAIPEADLVEGATIEIEEGTPFMNNYLSATKFVLKNGAWVLPTNYNPSFVSINSVFNHDANGFFIVQFNTDGWAQAAVPTSWSGITYNGEEVTKVATIQFYLTHSIWFNYMMNIDKIVANYNGYSHPTIQFEEGATVVYEGNTYTFSEVTFYLVGDKWTTEKPADYKVTEVVPEKPVVPDLGTPDCVFTGIGVWNNENGYSTLLEFTNFTNQPTTTESYKATTGYYITLNGQRLSEVNGANVYTWEGTYWLRIDVMNPAEGSILIIEEGTPFAGNYLPKLIFEFTEGKWHQAFTVNMFIGEEVFTVYSQNDIPVVIDDMYFENLLADNAIPGKVVSFSTRGVTYGAGTTFKVLTDTDLTVEVIGFDTTDGASVRLLTPTGIRYETKIDKADYDALVATYGEANIETGTYIVPKAMLGTTDFRAYFANSAKVDGTDYVKIVNVGWANNKTVDTDGYYLYYGSLVDLHPINYGTDFFGIGYIKITDGDRELIVFGGYNADDFTRSIYYVSSHAYKDYANGSPEQAVLKSYLDSVVYIADDAVISTLIDIDGYTSPYSISYDANTGVYTVTGNAEIKSVIIGDEKKVDARTSALLVGGEKYYVTDYDLAASANYSTLTFKLSPVVNPATLVDFTVEVASNRGVNILQLTDIELTDATQMRTASSLTEAEQTEYARKNIYANAFNYISTMVEQDRPDLIILTGDIVNGAFDDNGSMWLRVIEFMDSFNIPWAPVFGGMDNDSAMGAAWQIAQLSSAKNCLFKAGTLGGNGDYTIGITDKGVIKRVIFMLDSNAGAGINQAQVNWMKGITADIENCYGEVPAFVFCNQAPATTFTSDFKAANVDGVFMGNTPSDNSSSLSDGIYYTYGTKTGVYGDYDASKLGGTYIEVAANGATFTITAECLDKTAMENKESIHLVETYDGSSVVTDAYMVPLWETDRIYDETAVFVGETGSVTLMYTPTDPKEVVVRDITLGVTYTYGVDYTISGNKVTRVAGGNLPYRTYEEYYRKDPVVVNGVPQNWRVDTVEDDYRYSGTRYMYYAEAYEGASRHVTFTYNKLEAWTGTNFTGDENAQAFINQLKTEKQGDILFYGDSITVGCNASGTQWGGNRNPFLPSWDNLVTDSLARMYNANITKYNCAVGGWTTAQGAENFISQVESVNAKLADIDLLVLAFGMNDPATEDTKYIADIKSMVNTYYAANPNGSVVLVSPMVPNTQSNMVYGNHYLWENALNKVKNSQEYSTKHISLAKVFTAFEELLTVSGKLSRDYLGNNINHPTDFGVRIYAQVIMKTLCGDDFS